MRDYGVKAFQVQPYNAGFLSPTTAQSYVPTRPIAEGGRHRALPTPARRWSAAACRRHGHRGSNIPTPCMSTMWRRLSGHEDHPRPSVLPMAGGGVSVAQQTSPRLYRPVRLVRRNTSRRSWCRYTNSILKHKMLFGANWPPSRRTAGCRISRSSTSRKRSAAGARTKARKLLKHVGGGPFCQMRPSCPEHIRGMQVR